ncbi:ATP-binding cassette, subfamily C, CydC [Faunimonas pinastri]|uniref:ATP-binding cassette, subfamily C, CydC n=1 Tax=Faunimonas pinastri TaxID=1855383 RepID=A0A1H9A5M1_9HYPH|nr:thiol reductant ABC exporter subunit CydC [Faunimonas pinastri]SEP72036.1 ATP-binding cassette, subfamily C, CydC [Faunimonas pinastri]
MSSLFYFRGFFARRAGGLLLALFLSVVTLLAGVALLGTSGWFITATALTPAGMAFNLFGPSSLVRGFSFVRILARYGERLTGHNATLALLSDLRVWTFSRMIPLAGSRLRRLRGGDVVSRVTGDVEALDTVFLYAIAPIATVLLAGGLVVATTWIVLPAAALILAGTATAAALVVPALVIAASRKPGGNLVAAASDMRTAILDSIEGQADLLAFSGIAAAKARFGSTTARMGRAKAGQVRISATGTAIVQALAGLCLLGQLWVGLGALEAATISGPVLAGILLGSLAVFEATGPIMRGAGRLGAASAAARRLKDLAGSEPDIRDRAAPVPLQETGAITFDRVTFGYDPKRPVLRDFSLRIMPGERVAIVGPSGAGKSTILNLLLRLDDVQAGAVRFGGCDIRDAAQADLHARIAWLSQETPVFLGTIRDNLRIGGARADETAMRHALEEARLGDFIASLPRGLDTWIGEAGMTLSAGQARRLCLARALLRPAPVLVLDEPTSGLDSDTEEAFLSDLAGVARGRTMILVTHARLKPGMVQRVIAPFAGETGAT